MVDYCLFLCIQKDMSSQDFINAIQNKHLENTLKLAKQSSLKLGNKTYHKKLLSAKQWLDIVKLNQAMADGKNDFERNEFLIKVREKAALYYFGIPDDVFDQYYEQISPLLDGCILRSNMGTNSDIDFEEMLSRFSKFNDESLPPPQPTTIVKPSNGAAVTKATHHNKIKK